MAALKDGTGGKRWQKKRRREGPKGMYTKRERGEVGKGFEERSRGRREGRPKAQEKMYLVYLVYMYITVMLMNFSPVLDHTSSYAPSV